MTSFKDLGLQEEVLQGIEELGFQSPTPIQEKVINVFLEQTQDIIALAQTGTGKTAAFGLPLCQLVETDDRIIQALVLAPTRELCIQITRELKNYGQYVKNLRIEAVYGGESIEKQTKAIQNPPHILVATPGRLTDFIKRRKVDLSLLQWLVLDEADEMLNMGFEEDLSFIIEKTPESRRTLLFSATMSGEVLSVADRYMESPIEIEAGKRNSGTTNVSHQFYLIENRNRYNALKRLADVYPDIYGIVFCRTRKETQEIADGLTRDGYNADSLHGDLSQAQRDSVMKKFRDKNLNLLVATDVAARGIDVQNLSHVINYNLPDDTETYTHRSGRTGRANNTGISIALVTNAEKHKIKLIERKLQQKFEQKLLPKADEVLQQQVISFIDKIEKVEVAEDQIQPVIDEVIARLEKFDKKQLISQFIGYEIHRFLNYYKDAEDLNVRSDDRREKTRDGRDGREGRDRDRDARRVKIEISMGLKDGLNPARLLGIINEVWGNSKISVGKIDIQKKFTVFEIDKNDSDKLLTLAKKNLQGQGFTLNLFSGVIPMEDSREGGRSGGRSSGSSSRGGGSGAGSKDSWRRRKESR